tara:strand:+ start:91 stop:306 length:216 start_codon:yes stop_codon:yes gene_type:complete
MAEITRKQYDARRYFLYKCGLKQGTMSDVVGNCDDKIFAWLLHETAKGGYETLAEFVGDALIEYHYAEKTK